MPLPEPDCSVVVATFERPHQLRALLHALAAQTLPPNRYEVIVVNDGGATLLAPLLDPFHTQINLRLIEQTHAGPGAARNRGITAARGQWIAFTDDDCAPVPQWLETIQRTLLEHPDAMVGGSVCNALTSNVYSAASQRIGDIVYAFYNAQPANARFFSSNNMAASAALLRGLGGFDERFSIASEDRDLCERWRAAGLRLVYTPAAVVLHSHYLTLPSFCRQHFRYGQGAARFHRRRAELKSSAVEDHVAFHRNWRQWLFDPLRESRSRTAAALTALLVVWQAVNAAGFLWGWIKLRFRPHSSG
jgi:GT2 family glycosyltransferase